MISIIEILRQLKTEEDEEYTQKLYQNIKDNILDSCLSYGTYRINIFPINISGTMKNFDMLRSDILIVELKKMCPINKFFEILGYPNVKQETHYFNEKQKIPSVICKFNENFKVLICTTKITNYDKYSY